MNVTHTIAFLEMFQVCGSRVLDQPPVFLDPWPRQHLVARCQAQKPDGFRFIALMLMDELHEPNLLDLVLLATAHRTSVFSNIVLLLLNEKLVQAILMESMSAGEEVSDLVLAVDGPHILVADRARTMITSCEIHVGFVQVALTILITVSVQLFDLLLCLFEDGVRRRFYLFDVAQMVVAIGSRV